MRCIRSPLAVAAALFGPMVHAAQVTVEPLGAPGRYTGFEVRVQADGESRVAARVLLQAQEKWVARRLDRRRQDGSEVLELRNIDTGGTGSTPSLGAGSYVRITAEPDTPFPRLGFRLEIENFQRERWEQALGQAAPLCFLALPLPDARVWYVHGLLCPTPTWDPYSLTRPTIRGSWADNWSYGAALGSLTVPAMALWDDRSHQMVGYEWAEARLTDKSDKDIGIAYRAATPSDPEQCLTLLACPQRNWTDLADPELPTVIESHVRIIHSQDLPATSDPNRLVLQHVYRDYRRLLPTVPSMNDLSWMVPRDPAELGSYGPSGGAFLQTVRGGEWGWNQFFYDPGTVLYSNGFRGVDQMYKQGRTEAIARFESDLAEFLKHAEWMEIDGERCCTWRYPLTGSWNQAMGGEAACTTHHVAAFGVGAAMIACYAATGRDDLLPYIDGLYNWARHYVYTRGDIADIPESMFTLQISNLALDFLMNYRQVFADSSDAQRRTRAREALELAHMVVYRNANVTIGDSDERDSLSPAFMMPGNMAKFWLGQISNAELCDPFRAMIILHVETGDPVFKWLVRGALDRWWIGFKEDCWHTAENIDVWGVSTGEKGKQTGVHGPCDSFWEWGEPVGDAVMHVTCGARAAIAFCRGTRALDVERFSYRPPNGFRFRIVRVGKGAVEEPFSIIVSSPWRDLGGLAVRVHDAEVPQDRLRVLGTYHEHLLIPGVRVGDWVEVGEVRGAEALPQASVPAAGRPSDVPEEALQVGGRRFALIDLAARAGEALQADWSRPDHWGGLPSGLQYAHGVPYAVEPLAVGAGGSIAVKAREAYVLGVAAEPGSIRVTTGDREAKLGPGDGLLAAQGWPLCRWKLWLYPVSLEGGSGTVHVAPGGLVLGVTTLHEGRPLAQHLAEVIAAAKQPASGSALPEEARRRIDAAGGAKRAPVAFIPPFGRTYAPLASWAERLGLVTVPLMPEEFVDPAVFTPRAFPVAVYTGDEDYLRTVTSASDGERALLRYLQEGGTLVVAGICRPFTYARDLPDQTPQPRTAPWALFGRQFELFLLGPGERTDDAIGFEQPPAGVDLSLRLVPGQPVLWDFPSEVPYPTNGDARYRPLTRQGVDPRDEVVPLLITEGSDGVDYGPAAALIRHHCDRFKDAQVLWAWGTLLLPPFGQRDEAAAEILTYAVASSPAAREPLPEGLALALPQGEPRVAVLPPDCGSREEIIRGACRATGREVAFLTPDQFVSPTFFEASHFPIAIQAVSGERFILTYRTPSDGEEAYKRYLRQGGTLIVCQNATPFWYEMLHDSPANGDRTNEWTSRSPQRFWSMAFDLGFETQFGFEKPDETMWLELAPEGQAMWPDLPRRIELADLTDQRWRSLVSYRSSAARDFVPLARMTRPDGTPYPGLAAAMIRFRDSEYAGARLVYLWGNMVQGPLGETLLAGCLRRTDE